MSKAIKIIVILILLAILLKQPNYLINLGKTNEGMILYLIIMLLSSFLSTSIAILVGAVIIVIIKKGCDCQPTEVVIKNKSEKCKSKPNQDHNPIIFSSNILDSNKNTIYCGEDTKTYPTADNDKLKLMSFKNDLLHNHECMKSACCRNYAK